MVSSRQRLFASSAADHETGREHFRRVRPLRRMVENHASVPFPRLALPWDSLKRDLNDAGAPEYAYLATKDHVHSEPRPPVTGGCVRSKTNSNAAT